jgi:hypothetical protein
MMPLKGGHHGQIHLGPISPALILHQIERSDNVVVAVITENIMIRLTELTIRLVDSRIPLLIRYPCVIQNQVFQGIAKRQLLAMHGP